MQPTYVKQNEPKTVLGKIAAVHIAHSVLSVLFIGLFLLLSGVLVEANHQVQLLDMGGSAYENYQTAMHALSIDSIFEYMVVAMKLELLSLGGNLQGIGLAVLFMLAPVVLVSHCALRLAGYKPAIGSFQMV